MLLEFQTLFQASPISLIQYIGGGRAGRGWGGRWGRVGSRRRVLPYIWTENSHCVFIEVHRQPQFTCQADMVADGSLIPSVALLVHPRGTTHSIEDCHEFTGSQKWCRWKQTWLFVALPLVCLDSAGVWLSCQPIIWISVLAGLFRVFANQVTYVLMFCIKKFLIQDIRIYLKLSSHICSQ